MQFNTFFEAEAGLLKCYLTMPWLFNSDLICLGFVSLRFHLIRSMPGLPSRSGDGRKALDVLPSFHSDPIVD